MLLLDSEAEPRTTVITMISSKYMGITILCPSAWEYVTMYGGLRIVIIFSSFCHCSFNFARILFVENQLCNYTVLERPYTLAIKGSFVLHVHFARVSVKLVIVERQESWCSRQV